MSNGSLMRITPMAVWCQNLPTEGLEKAVIADVSMTHAKIDMFDISIAYVLAIQTLIKNPEDPNRAEMALQAIKTYANTISSNCMK
jgi:ADP-ribosylglycohydrolase